MHSIPALTRPLALYPSRLARQFGFHLGPLASPSPSELLVPLVAAAAAAFLIA